MYTGGRLLYRLCSCQPTVKLAIGKLKNYFFQVVNNQAHSGTIPFPLYIDFPGSYITFSSTLIKVFQIFGRVACWKQSFRFVAR